jgi:hypothetical protein
MGLFFLIGGWLGGFPVVEGTITPGPGVQPEGRTIVVCAEDRTFTVSAE